MPGDETPARRVPIHKGAQVIAIAAAEAPVVCPDRAMAAAPTEIAAIVGALHKAAAAVVTARVAALVLAVVLIATPPEEAAGTMVTTATVAAGTIKPGTAVPIVEHAM